MVIQNYIYISIFTKIFHDEIYAMLLRLQKFILRLFSATREQETIKKKQKKEEFIDRRNHDENTVAEPLRKKLSVSR